MREREREGYGKGKKEKGMSESRRTSGEKVRREMRLKSCGVCANNVGFFFFCPGAI